MPGSLLRPADVAQHLNIPASTLRRWSYYFADYLPSRAQDAGGAQRSHRRYSDADVRVLVEVKHLLAKGLTYEQVRQELDAWVVAEQETALDEGEVVEGIAESIDAEIEDGAGEGAPPSERQQHSLANRLSQDSSAPELASLVAETLFSLSDSQQIILGGQQTARQLLGVLLQDNFNLKEENSRLRERILETERKLFELKREMDGNQTAERERMRQMESYLFDLQRRLDSLAPQVVRHAPAVTAGRAAVVPPPARPAPGNTSPAAIAPAFAPAPANPTGTVPPPAAPPAPVPPPPSPPDEPPDSPETPVAAVVVETPAFAAGLPDSAPATPEGLPAAEPVALPQPPNETPPAAVQASTRWQRFTDWLFGRSLEDE